MRGCKWYFGELWIVTSWYDLSNIMNNSYCYLKILYNTVQILPEYLIFWFYKCRQILFWNIESKCWSFLFGVPYNCFVWAPAKNFNESPQVCPFSRFPNKLATILFRNFCNFVTTAIHLYIKGMFLKYHCFKCLAP